MNWIDYVKQNSASIRSRYTLRIPKDPRRNWCGFNDAPPALTKDQKLFVPDTFMSYAGHINLKAQTIVYEDNASQEGKERLDRLYKELLSCK